MMAILMTFEYFIETMSLTNQDFLVASINYKQTGKLFGYITNALKKLIAIKPFKTLAEETDMRILTDQVIMKKSNNVLRAISHEAGQYDSFHFKLAIFDEIGEIKSRDRISKITSGQVKVPNKQFVQISTSYPDPTVPFHSDQKRGQQIMEQDWKRDNDDYLALIWAQDSLDETFMPETWAKSNPLLDLPNAIKQFKNSGNKFTAYKSFRVDKIAYVNGMCQAINYDMAGGKDANWTTNGIPLAMLDNVTRGNYSATRVGDQVKFKAGYAYGTIDQYDNASNGAGIVEGVYGNIWYNANSLLTK